MCRYRNNTNKIRTLEKQIQSSIRNWNYAAIIALEEKREKLRQDNNSIIDNIIHSLKTKQQ